MDPFIGEISIFAGTFAPKGWMLCDGQLLPIRNYVALFSILGVQYGGDGKNTFALPNLNGRVPIGTGEGLGLTPRYQGEAGGSASVTLLAEQMPPHLHTGMGFAGNGTTSDPANAVWAQYNTTTRPPTTTPLYGTNSDVMPMAAASLAPAGGGQPHNNMQPYLGLNFIIAMEGVFPPRP